MSRMDKLSLACAVISKEKQDQIIEDIRRKDGSVPVRTLIRRAFEADRWATAAHEAAHVVVGFLFGRRLGTEGVAIRDPRRGKYCRGGYCTWSACSAVTIVEAVIGLQAGRLAEASADKGLNPVSENEAVEALSMLDATVAIAMLRNDNLSDLEKALHVLKSARPAWGKDQIVSTYIELQKVTETFIQQPLVKCWIFRVAMALSYAETGMLSDAEARDAIGEDMTAAIEAVRRSIHGRGGAA